MKHLAGRAAIVTGAASGIGLAIAEAFAAEGLRVLMADLSGDAVEAAASRLRESGADARPYVLDVRDPDAVEAAGQAAVDAFGALHVAVNNAGIVNWGVTWELPLDEWHRVLDVNLWGVIHGVRAFVPRIVACGEEGHVVNVASVAAVVAHPALGPYTVAKHGVLALSDVLRADLEAAGARVGVSVVMPGGVKTAMNPIGTVEPSTVAANVVDAMRTDRAYVFTDRQASAQLESRLQSIMAARADVVD